MKNLSLFCSLAIGIFACQHNEQETPEPTDFGYLSMNIAVTITSEPASGRVEAVSTDNWRVTIFSAIDDSEVMVFDPYASAPSEVSLPTGEYYIEAHSNNFQEAAFENPYYFGRSDNFTIDKEELKTIDIDAELANSKVAINYSPNVTSTFDTYTGAVTVVNSNTTLVYGQGETREGYFVSEALFVVVDLSYEKLDGTFITRQFTADIDAQPKTFYNINVDASLEDGKIVLNINVDETFDEVDIQLGDVVVVSPDPNTAVFDSEVYPLVDAYIDDYSYESSLDNGTFSHYGYEVGVSDAAFVVFTETGGQQYFVGTDGASMKIYFMLYVPIESGTGVTGTYGFIDTNTATQVDINSQFFFSGGEIEFDDDGILPNGDFEDAEYSITGGTIIVSGAPGNYTVEFDLETDGGPVLGNYTGDFQYLDNTAN